MALNGLYSADVPLRNCSLARNQSDFYRVTLYIMVLCICRPVDGADQDGQRKKDPRTRPRPLYDIPYMFEAREFLRKKLIGKKVTDPRNVLSQLRACVEIRWKMLVTDWHSRTVKFQMDGVTNSIEPEDRRSVYRVAAFLEFLEMLGIRLRSGKRL